MRSRGELLARLLASAFVLTVSGAPQSKGAGGAGGGTGTGSAGGDAAGGNGAGQADRDGGVGGVECRLHLCNVRIHAVITGRDKPWQVLRSWLSPAFQKSLTAKDDNVDVNEAA
jgi:hypothetical protein